MSRQSYVLDYMYGVVVDTRLETMIHSIILNSYNL